MSTNLVIVESAAKSKTITKYLNSSKELKGLGKFVVVASFGHVRDLQKKDLGIDIEKNFTPRYVIIDDKQKLIDDLKRKAKEASTVYLASDPDREGEGIAQHLKDVLELKKYKRITFTEITQKALEKAIQNPRTIDQQLVDAQETRRILDRIVGFKLSPLLWKKYTTNSASTLSAGRVQSAVLHIIIQKETEIKEFDSTPYWNILANFVLSLSKDKTQLKDVKLYKGSTIHKIPKIEDVVAFFSRLSNKYTIQDIRTRLVKQSADLPFITSTLQQEAYSKLGMPLKRTMQLAQDLYEGGFITYMRTDSYNMSDDFKEHAKSFIEGTYGDYYEGGSKKKGHVKGAQEAHECIRVTDATQTTITGDKFSKDHKSLYDMIWKRSIAYLMKQCIYDELEIKITDSSFAKDFSFQTSFRKVKFNGFMIVYGVENEVYDFSEILDKVRKGSYGLVCENMFSKNIWTSPPQRYNESSIVKVLETEGLGRPSTYSTIMSKLFERRYIIKADITGEKKDVVHVSYTPSTKKVTKQTDTTIIGSDKTKIIPTEIGYEIDKYLALNFDYIVDKNFTALMENDLDKIAEGQKDKLSVLNLFWKHFEEDLKKQGGIKEKKQVLQAKSNEVEINGIKYIVRIAKYGPVIQYDGNKYINLKPYLLLVRKQYTDIDENDISFLVNLPRVIAQYNNKPMNLVYGPYGLYIKYNNTNKSISKYLALKFIKGEQITEEDIQKVLDYQSKKSSSKIKDDKADGKKIVKKKA